jgi:hypothetical protein
MELDLVGQDAVHLGLGLGQELEDSERIPGHGRREPTCSDQPADLAEPAMTMVSPRVPRPRCRGLVETISFARSSTVIMAMKVVMMMVKVIVIVPMVVVMVTMSMMVVVVPVPVPMVVAVVTMSMVVNEALVVVVVMLIDVIDRSSAGGIEHVELGPGDAPVGHLSRSEIHRLHADGGHVAPDLIEARSQIEESAHEHVAAHPCRCVEVEDPLHVDLSLRPWTASLLTMSAV